MFSELLDCVDDPHEFATAYTNHVEDARRSGEEPLPVSFAVHRFAKTGVL